jgi:transposase InsO family protein
LSLTTKTRFTAEEKAEVLAVVERTVERAGWSVRRILKRLGVTKGRYYEWRKRAAAERLVDAPCLAPSWAAILPEEKEAVITYALKHPKDGYRRLAWMMIDEDVAYLSPSSVYRVLTDVDLLYRWKRSRSAGEAPAEAQAPNERWHTDIMYLRVADTWYFLVSVLDAYSRYIVHWELLTSMRAADVRLAIQQAVEKSGAKPEIVTDNGSQFTAKDFRALVHQFELQHIRIRTYHPESNGRIERFHRSTRDALSEQDLGNLTRAREILSRWVEHYNGERLHAGLHYLPPAEYYSGNPDARLEERRTKLEEGRRRREAANRQRHQQAA